MTERLIEARIDSLNKAAEEFLQATPQKTTFAFHGPMGAGKTTFIRALCQTLECQENPVSPSFSLINEYYSRKLNKKIHHIDLYRLKNTEEALALGIDDYINDAENINFIEWPELIETLLPPDAVHVYIEPSTDSVRTIRIVRHE